MRLFWAVFGVFFEIVEGTVGQNQRRFVFRQEFFQTAEDLRGRAGVGTEVGGPLHGLVGAAGPEDEVVPAGPQHVAFPLLALGGEHASSIFTVDSADFIRANIKC